MANGPRMAKTLSSGAGAAGADRGVALLRTMVRIRVLEEGIEKHSWPAISPVFAHLSTRSRGRPPPAPVRTFAATTRSRRRTAGTGTRSPREPRCARWSPNSSRARPGVCKGKGGSMHIADFSVGMLGANGVVAGGFGLVAGAALSAVLRKTDQVAVCFFGDGATNRGPFHENLNLCAIWNLPAIFVLETIGTHRRRRRPRR